MASQMIFWRRLDLPGAEAARVALEGSAWRLRGTVVLVHEGRPCCLDYAVICDRAWRTRRAVVSEEASIRAAWLRFPGFELQPLEQIYRRESERRYRYESGGGRFAAELQVDDFGLVVRYGDYWVAEARLEGDPDAGGSPEPAG